MIRLKLAVWVRKEAGAEAGTVQRHETEPRPRLWRPGGVVRRDARPHELAAGEWNAASFAI